MLMDLGYDVVEASSGEEALRLIDDGLRPDLVVTDHLMPGMTGVELARALRARRPSLPLLIISGYAEEDGMDPSFARLTKPFRNSELTARLAEMPDFSRATRVSSLRLLERDQLSVTNRPRSGTRWRKSAMSWIRSATRARSVPTGIAETAPVAISGYAWIRRSS